MYRFVVAVVFVASTIAVAADWPQFLGPNRDGVSSETGLLKTWPQDGPPVAWKKDVGEGYSGPVIASGRLIVFHRLGDKEVVECWNAADGKFQWKYDYDTAYVDQLGKGNGPRSTPSIADKRVATLGAEGELSCLDLEKGTKIWAKRLTKEYAIPESYFGIGTSPVIDDGLVLVNVGAKNAGIVAFALKDGKEIWKATSDGASYSSPVVRTVGGTKHAIFLTRQGVVILDPKSGDVRHRQKWRAVNDASVNAATPLVIGDQVFFSASYETGALLLKLRKDGADEVWSTDELMSNHYNTCVVHEGHLYGCDGRQENGARLRCVDLKGKKATWTKPRFGCATMVSAEGRLIAMTEKGDLVLIEANPKEYRELGRAQVLDAGPVRAQIALADGKLYARDLKKLACFDLKAK